MHALDAEILVPLRHPISYTFCEQLRNRNPRAPISHRLALDQSTIRCSLDDEKSCDKTRMRFHNWFLSIIVYVLYAQTSKLSIRLARISTMLWLFVYIGTPPVLVSNFLSHTGTLFCVNVSSAKDAKGCLWVGLIFWLKVSVITAIYSLKLENTSCFTASDTYVFHIITILKKFGVLKYLINFVLTIFWNLNVNENVIKCLNILFEIIHYIINVVLYKYIYL